MRVIRALSVLLVVSIYGFAATPDRIAGAIDASQVVRLESGVPRQARAEYDQGAVEPGFKLGTVTLLTTPTVAQQRALDKLMADQQNPSSPNYHKWLTPEQYGERFGLSQRDIDKITTWLKAQGFTGVSVARGRNWISFAGTAAQVQSAFHTEIHRYSVDGEMHFANATPAALPASMAGVVIGVRGLHDFRMKPASSGNRMHRNYYDSTSKGTFLAPGDIATIYDVNPLYALGFDGTGQTIAVIGQTDIYTDDIVDFRSSFGLSAISGCTTSTTGVLTACDTANFKYVLVLPPGGVDPGAPDTVGDLPEADLDIEWSGAVAKGAKIIYVNAPTGNGVNDSLAYAIDNIVSPVISMSYGLCELDEAKNGTLVADETEYKKANIEGITFVNSSGDSGAAACDFGVLAANGNLAVGGLAVSYPASSVYVTGVGGTAITTADLTTNFSTYWSTTDGATGGSAVKYMPEQGWSDIDEWGVYCAANSNPFCTRHSITSPLTAQQNLGVIFAGGGGASACVRANPTTGVCTSGFAQPSWQGTLTVPGQSAARFVPDIALLSSVYFTGNIICTATSELSSTGTSASSCASGISTAINTWGSIFGGTSVATPEFAGMVAIMNQYFQGTASNGLGNINPMLYKLAAKAQTATGSNGFNHVLTGNNFAFCVPLTPSIQPVALQCPNSGANSEVGYLASNADATTGYNLVTGLGSIDMNNLVTAWAAGRTASTTLVAATPTSVILGNTVKLTATVTPATAVGTVSFFKSPSTTALGTATLDGTTGTGVFTWTPATTDVGTDSITASFGGDGYNAPSTTVTAATVTVTSPDFAWVANTPKLHTVLAGQQSLAYSFTATPVGATTLPITFGCTFLPADTTLSSSSCVFTPASIPTGTSGATSVSVQITTTGPNKGTGPSLQHQADKRSPWLPLALPIAGMVMVGLVGRRVSKYSAVAGLCVSLALIGLMIACGGGGSNPISVTVGAGNPSSLFPNNSGWPNQTATFNANVGNDSTNKGVTWSVTGSPANGTIDASGVYTAPTLAAGLPATVTITATSVTDPSKSGSAQETLQKPTALTTFNVTVTATEGLTAKQDTVTLTVK